MPPVGLLQLLLGEEGGEPASPFDRLPNEVVADILDELFHGDEDYSPKLPDLLVNRRIFLVAKAVWHSSQTLDSEHLHRLVLAADVRPLVRRIAYTLSGEGVSSFKFETLSLTVFENLRTLSLTGPVHRELEPVAALPAAWSDALASLKHLRSLNLDFDEDFELVDRTFSIGSHLPSLRSLSLGTSCLCKHQLLDYPCPNLQSLGLMWDVDVTASPFSVIPWTTLINLSVVLWDDKQTQVQADAGLAPLGQLNSTTPAALPLRRLELADPILLPPSVSPLLLGATSLQRLDLSPKAPSQMPIDFRPVPSPSTLVLHQTPSIFHDSEELYGLYQMLSIFPSLTHLCLEDSGPEYPETAPDRQSLEPNSPEFILRYPALTALLAALTKTGITHLTWQTDPEMYRWTRSGVEASFVGERWRGMSASSWQWVGV
ncbi:hypothetical protein JCM8097_005607 [Rhodosporidiobolus ruineniae]